jgi:APA family basic amino acid/polyamine antiporter
MFAQVDKETNMPTNSSVFGLFVCGFWLLYFFGANLTSGWFGLFNYDSSELPVITVYAFYIPIIIVWIIKEKQLSIFKRFVLPILSIISCLVLIFVAIMSHGVTPYLAAKEVGKFSFPVLFYLIMFVVIMGIGYLCSNDFRKLIKKNKSK